MEFSQRVTVALEAVRVIGEDQGARQIRDPNDPGSGTFYRMILDPSGARITRFHDSRPRRTAGRYRTWDDLDDPGLRLDGSLWPGLPVPVEWVEPYVRLRPRGYELEPSWQPMESGGKTYKSDEAYARLRRFKQGRSGIVVGQTWRDEGVPVSPSGGEDAASGYLFVERKIPLFEVVLEHEGRLGKATMVLAHENDLTAI